LRSFFTAAGVAGGIWWAHRSMAPAPSCGAMPRAASAGKKVLYWHDPMVPGQRFDKPGKSPFMDMQLVPVYAEDDAAGAAGVKVSPQLAQNLGVRTALAEKGRIARNVDVVGTVAFDERAVTVVQARTPHSSSSSSFARRWTRCAAGNRSRGSSFPSGPARSRNTWP
jgi:Cu(I)/Ag(I) efflux system membrane fusion protein